GAGAGRGRGPGGSAVVRPRAPRNPGAGRPPAEHVMGPADGCVRVVGGVDVQGGRPESVLLDRAPGPRRRPRVPPRASVRGDELLGGAGRPGSGDAAAAVDLPPHRPPGGDDNRSWGGGRGERAVRP